MCSVYTNRCSGSSLSSQNSPLRRATYLFELGHDESEHDHKLLTILVIGLDTSWREGEEKHQEGFDEGQT